MSKKIKLSSLIQDDKNNNKHTAYGMDLLEKSVNKVGIIESITVSNDDKIISGNARHEIIGKNFTKEALVIETDGTQPIIIKRTDIESDTKKFYEASILANTTSKKNIDFDMEVIDSLAVEYDIDVVDLGVDVIEEEHLEAEEDDFNGVPPKEPITVLGDLYEIGEHRLLCGDSTDSDQVAKLMNGEKADMVFTDPPYNIDYQGVTKGNHEKITNDKMSDEDFTQFLYDALNINCDTFYVCCSWQYSHLFRKALEDLQKPVKSFIVWDKINPAQHLDKYFKQHEIILYHGKFGGQKTLRGDVWQTKRQRNTVHPTMKPIEIIEMALNDNTDKKNIYDAFLGSGSTMVASHQLKRKCYGMELDPKYCDVIVARMIKLDSTLPIKRNGTLLTKSELDKFTANTSDN
jgi:DNA modification methylase